MKSLWITALEKEQQTVQELIATAQKYGLGADGHFWQNDLAKMAWLAVKEQLLNQEINLWVITGQESSLTPEVRYGLTLLTMSIQQERPTLAILWLDSSSKMDRAILPGIFANSTFMAADSPTLGAKLAAMANIPGKQQIHPYRLKVHANPGFGVWFEVGPAGEDQWHGSIFGTNQGEIKAHGIGDNDRIPEKCVLEYPIKGMELQSGDNNYIAWGIQNSLTAQNSYYVKVEGIIHSLLFGALPADEEAELHVLKM